MRKNRDGQVNVLNSKIKEITELLTDFSWPRTPDAIAKLQQERNKLLEKRRALLRDGRGRKR